MIVEREKVVDPGESVAQDRPQIEKIEGKERIVERKIFLDFETNISNKKKNKKNGKKKKRFLRSKNRSIMIGRKLRLGTTCLRF